MFVRLLKQANHLGSGALLMATMLIAVVVVAAALGLNLDWKVNTTPYRLSHQSFAAWSLLTVLCMGLILMRMGAALLQCVTTLIFIGIIYGIAITSALFWDAWLAPMLVFSSLPMKYATVQALQSIVQAQASSPTKA